MAIGSKLGTLAVNVSQNTDVIDSLGTVLEKVKLIAKVTANAVDVLAEVDISTPLLKIGN